MAQWAINHSNQLRPTVKRGDAAGRSASLRATTGGGGPAGLSHPDSFWRSAFCRFSGRPQLQKRASSANFAPVCASPGLAESTRLLTNEPRGASECGDWGQKSRLQRLRRVPSRVFEKLSGYEARRAPPTRTRQLVS